MSSNFVKEKAVENIEVLLREAACCLAYLLPKAGQHFLLN